MTMAAWVKVDNEHIADGVQDACERLHGSDDEVVLDFSSVQRIDTHAIDAMVRLAAMADDTGAKVILRGVNAEVYKVLKLVSLASRFSFLAPSLENR